LAGLLAANGACFGQTCAITSPGSGQIIQTVQPFQFTAAVSSAPSAYKLIWSVDYQRWAAGYARDTHPNENDYRDVWQGPWTVTWYSGLNGDGPHTVSGVVQDIFGTQLATCAPVNFIVRAMGVSNQSISAYPTNGSGPLVMKTFDGHGNELDPVVAVDGRPLPYDNYCGGAGTSGATGGFQVPNFNTTCFPNGQRQLLMAYNTMNVVDPYMLAVTFTSSNVSGNNITVPNHYSYQNSIVTFSSTGTLPAPLVAGCQYSSNTSTWGAGNSNIAGYSISGGAITVTLSSGCNISPGTPVFLRNIHYTDMNGNNACDGYYNVASVSGTGSGTTFTVKSPSGCVSASGLAGTWQFEVDVNPYFVQYVDQNTISVAAAPGGGAITLTNGGSGTHSVLQRVRSPYWSYYGDFFNQQAVQSTSAPAYVIQVANFNNGTKPMEIEVPYWEMHLIAGAATQSVCPKIKNTDLTFTTIACNASGLTYTEVDDGGVSGVCSVDSSGNVTPIMAGWCQVLVQCAACAAGGVSLAPVSVYIQIHSGSINAPQFTHNGTVATAFSPGNSFFPLSAWHLDIKYFTLWNGVTSSWAGPMMQESNLNSSMIEADPSGTAFGDPAGTSCYSATWPSSMHIYESAFAVQYGTYFEAGIESTHWGPYGAGNLAALLNNAGYNRQSCFTGFLSQLGTEGRTWRTFGYDELNAYMAGNYPFRNPNLGATNFPSIVVSGGVATYNVAETFNGAWNQAAGTGDWIKMAGAVTNTCLNGWFPVTGITNNGAGYPVSFTTASTCANGTYTESTAQLYHYWVNPNISGGGENADTLPRLYGTGNDNNVQNWDGTFFTQIVVSGGVAEFYMQGHAIPNGRAIRVHGSVNGLNVVAPATVIDANHFSITYNGLFGTVPANGTYNSGNDAGLFVTVDPNFPPTPFLNLRALINSVTGHPATTWPAIGYTFTAGNPGVRNWTGNPAGEDAANDYVPQPPFPIYGTDAGVWQWATYSQSSSGLATRAYQLQPRAMLWSGGPQYNHYCVSFEFNPACDHPKQLYWRPETLVAQLIGMLTLNVNALRLYNFDQTTSLDFANCCGWNSPGTGTGGVAMAPYISPKQWSAMAHTDALIKLREDTELQPLANKPYMGPYFLTDAHSSPTYGNELKILCASETPYGLQTRALPRISGGSMLKYILTGYSLSVQVMSGNPATDTDEYCSSPGRVTTYVALPAAPAVQPIDHLTFAPPTPLPFGASKFLVQVGYYPRAMQDDPVTDCTSVCTIAVDHHNTNAWYRVIYADANSLPLSIGDPAKIPSQGLF
jgi:hypothetical protein